MNAAPEAWQFLSDVRKFGPERARTRLRHRDTISRFKSRQHELAITGAMFVGAYLLFGVLLFAAMATLVFTTATREATRMRACGRYHQCRRSLETVGF